MSVRGNSFLMVVAGVGCPQRREGGANNITKNRLGARLGTRHVLALPVCGGGYMSVCGNSLVMVGRTHADMQEGVSRVSRYHQL